MKNRILPLFGLAFAAATANAQTWTAPVPATQANPQSKALQYLYNVEANQFLTGGGYWGYQAALSDRGSAYLLTDSVGSTLAQTGWTVQVQDTMLLHRDGKIRWNTFMFNDGTTAYQDMGTQGHNFWSFEKQANGYYRIRTIAADANYGSGETALGENYNHNWFGHISTTTDSTLVTTADPSNTDYTSQVDWAFVSPEAYKAWHAKKMLYNALNAAQTEGGIDLTAYAATYNNSSSTIEALKAAADELLEKVRQRQVYAVLDGASETTPKDATSLLTNPAFEAGNASGWTNTFKSGTNANNVGYQGASYTNGEVTISKFIEAWSNTAYSTAISGRALGNGELSQTMKSLPAGKYKLAVDVIAVNQDGITPVVGVQLFAKGGDVDTYETVATGNRKPEHFEVTFISTGGDIVMGLRTNATNANWIAADNFSLTYYGATVEDPYKVALDQVIAKYEAKYPDLGEVFANLEVEAAYAAALAAAKAATSDYATYSASLDEAASALAQSVTEYAAAKEDLEEINARITEVQAKGWNDLVDILSEYRDQIQEGYDAGTLTSEAIAAIDGIVSGHIGTYVSANAQAGDDVSILLKNPNFDKNFSGWDMAEGSATPAFGGLKKNPNGTYTAGAEGLTSGCAEVYHNKFDISQTVKNMPRGLYTLSCQAFERNENAGVEAELYAVINGVEQTLKIKEINEDASDDQLYAYGSETPDGNSDRQNGEGKWIPDGMSGANQHFAAGYYKNKFSIVVTEQTDIKVGIRTASTVDWVLFDAFKFVYEGSGASVYTETLQSLIAAAQAVGEGQGEVLTQEASQKVMDAIAAAEDAISASDEDACIAAIQQLKDAKAFAEASVAHVAKLAYLNAYTLETRMSSVTSSDGNLSTIVDEISAKLEDETLESEAEVDNYLLALKRGFTVFAQIDHLDATETNPADLSSVILMGESVDNAGNGSSYGWETEGTIGFGSGISEVFNQGEVNVTQTLYGLAPGYYRLGVQGYYRATGYATEVDANDVDTLAYNVDIVAGNLATRLMPIKGDAERYNTLVGGTTADKWAIPAATAGANNAFENTLYQNYLLFQVAEGQTEVSIGFKKKAGLTNDWLAWDNWTLQYWGTATPTTDPTTDIREAASAEQVVSTAIYSLDGTPQARLLKGVNIVKTTLADGTVRVSKVLVR